MTLICYIIPPIIVFQTQKSPRFPRSKGNIRAIYFENLPLKKEYDRFLIIRSIQDPTVFTCSALTYDEKPLGPKMANVWLPKDVILGGNEYYLFSLDHKKVVDVLKLDGEPTRLE